MTYAIHQRGGFLGGKKFAIGQRSRTMFAFLEECRTIKPSRSMLRIMRVRLYKRKANSAKIRPLGEMPSPLAPAAPYSHGRRPTASLVPPRVPGVAGKVRQKAGGRRWRT